MARTIVILHPGGFGDLLLAVPAIRALRQRFPGHEVILCGEKQTAEFLVECGLVDRAMSVQTTACTALFGGAASEDPVLRDWLSRCDLAVAWTSDEAGTLAAALNTCGAAAVLVQSPFASTLASVHQSDRFLEIAHGPPDHVSVAPLSLPEMLRDEAEACLGECGIARNRPIAVIHPGSGSRHKCVRPEILLPVLEGLEAREWDVLLLEGPADGEMVQRLLSRMSRLPIVLRGLSLRVLAGVLAQTELFVGHDSGVTHLASLLGTPTVGLFGPTDPARWAPRGNSVTIVRGKRCGCTSWQAVTCCAEKPCLDISPTTIFEACQNMRPAALNPRIC